MGRRIIRSSHDNKRSSSNNNKSSLSSSSCSSLLKIISWFLFGLAQCILIKKYHDAAYKGNISVDNTHSHTTTTQSVSKQFEQELILQGIGGIGGIGGIRNKNMNNHNRKSSSSSSSKSESSESSTNQQEEQQKQKQEKTLPEPDGIFNGYPIYKFPPRTKNKKYDENKNKNKNNKKNESFENNEYDNNNNELYSQFHCVGETWESPILHKR